jgi:GNAT superfamily N-acetyltransferase
VTESAQPLTNEKPRGTVTSGYHKRKRGTIKGFNMDIRVRQANLKDIDAIAVIKQLVWPEDTVDKVLIARVIAHPDHVILIAWSGNNPVGFADGFMTNAADGTRRWEVDLLAVHPSYRRCGIGRGLVAASTKAGIDAGCGSARALIGIDNLASQRTFAACQYQMQAIPCVLYVTAGVSEPLTRMHHSAAAHFVPVLTLNYEGIWIEGAVDKNTLRNAQSICHARGYHVAGVIVPETEDRVIHAAEVMRFAYIGRYHLWEWRKGDRGNLERALG